MSLYFHSASYLKYLQKKKRRLQLYHMWEGKELAYNNNTTQEQLREILQTTSFKITASI